MLKSSGEQEDGVFDWMLLNNGKGWEAGTNRDRRDDRDRHRETRASAVPQAPAAAAQQQSGLQRSGSKGGRKSGGAQQQMQSERSQAAQLRASHGDFNQNGSGYGGVGHASNVAVHDATVAGIPTQGGTREHSHVGHMTPTAMSSGNGLDGGRRADGRQAVVLRMARTTRRSARHSVKSLLMS